MAPRNNDANTNYKKENFPVEDSDADIKNIVPCLLHKKHKVVKLVKAQINKIQEEGLICAIAGTDAEPLEGETLDSGLVGGGRFRRAAEDDDPSGGQRATSGLSLCVYAVVFLSTLFLLIYLMVWISVGPLSNSIAHTPIPAGSFVRTEGVCSLEKKYLLRWSKPEYYE